VRAELKKNIFIVSEIRVWICADL